jgi:hypothetical protein
MQTELDNASTVVRTDLAGEGGVDDGHVDVLLLRKQLGPFQVLA